MQKQNDEQREQLNRLIRLWILRMTTEAGSGHPTSSLSGVELMSTLFFQGFFRYDVANPDSPNNDRLIFSKGHASPLYYALWAAAEAIDASELSTLRQFWSRLEGHPTRHFPFADVATGSLGQGLSVGLGMALAARDLDKVGAYTWVFLGDSEMAEGQVWEAMESAAHYKCHNLVAIVDVNRLGQRGETMTGHNMETYHKRAESFGWNVITIEGHDTEEITNAYTAAVNHDDKPTMIFAKTLKGKGVSFLEDQEGWHGKVLSDEELEKAIKELGQIDEKVRGAIAKPPMYELRDASEAQAQDIAKQKTAATSAAVKKATDHAQDENTDTNSDSETTIVQETDNTQAQSEEKSDREIVTYDESDFAAVRDAFGTGLVQVMRDNPRVVVLDAEVSNSTRSEKAKEAFPKRFYEMYIAEQNMAGVAMGFAARGYVPYISSFAAFLTRAHGQIRMAALSKAQLICVGTHPGVSIGADGASQMGLEDLSFFRAILGSVVLYPCDATSAQALTVQAAELPSIVYLRMTREETPVLYGASEEFPVGGSKTLCTSIDDRATIIAAGITLHEALLAYDTLKQEGIAVRVIDAYSIKPLDVRTVRAAAADTHTFVIVEDHYPEGGLGDAVRAALDGSAVNITHLAVRKAPRSGQTKELLAYEEIDAQAIVRAVHKAL